LVSRRGYEIDTVLPDLRLVLSAIVASVVLVMIGLGALATLRTVDSPASRFALLRGSTGDHAHGRGTTIPLPSAPLDAVPGAGPFAAGQQASDDPATDHRPIRPEATPASNASTDRSDRPFETTFQPAQEPRSEPAPAEPARADTPSDVRELRTAVEDIAAAPRVPETLAPDDAGQTLEIAGPVSTGSISAADAVAEAKPTETDTALRPAPDRPAEPAAAVAAQSAMPSVGRDDDALSPPALAELAEAPSPSPAANRQDSEPGHAPDQAIAAAAPGATPPAAKSSRKAGARRKTAEAQQHARVRPTAAAATRKQPAKRDAKPTRSAAKSAVRARSQVARVRRASAAGPAAPISTASPASPGSQAPFGFPPQSAGTPTATDPFRQQWGQSNQNWWQGEQPQRR
jgi:hypothetical protein